MNKPVTLIFYGADDNAGRAMAEMLRSEGAMSVFLRDAGSFHGATDDPADKVIIMPDVSERKAQMIRKTYPFGIASVYFPEYDSANRPEGAIVTSIVEAPVKRGRGRQRKAVA